LDPTTPFKVILAASQGNVELLKQLLDDGGDPNVTDYDKRTPLHLAAAEGHLEVCKYLVEQKKANVNALDRWGHTPLTEAIKNRFFIVAQYLRSKGGIVANHDTDLVTALCRAASTNNVEKLKILIEEGADVNAGDYDHRTALHLAASEGHYEAAEFLIKAGANVNVMDRWGSTPLQDAITASHDRVAELLMKHGARIEKDTQKIKNDPAFLSALQKTLNLLCFKEKWDFGMAWLPSADRREAKPTDAWFGQTARVNQLASYRRVCDGVVVPRGQGFIGKVLETSQPIWIDDISVELNQSLEYLDSTKVSIVKEMSFKATVAVPVIYNDVLMAILEFRSAEVRPKTNESLSFMTTAATRSIVSSALRSSPKEPQLSSHRGAYAEQMNVVYHLLLQESIFHESVILNEVDWFYNGLGLNEYYFQHHSPQIIAKHILAFIAAKQYAHTTGTNENIRYINEEKTYALYICPIDEQIAIERTIEEKYLGEGYAGSQPLNTEAAPFSLKHFVSSGTASPNSSQKICLYFVDMHPFINPKANEKETDLWKIATGVFLRDKSASAKIRYQKILSEAVKNFGPVVMVDEDPLVKGDCVVTIAYKKGTTHSFMSAITQLMRKEKLNCPRKYIEPFSNGYVVHSLHFVATPEQCRHFADQASFTFMLPRTSLTPLYADNKLNLKEVAYAYAAWKFSFHFLKRSSEEFNMLWNQMKNDPVSQSRLLQLKKRMRNDVATEARCFETIVEYPDIIRDLYQDFEKHHAPRKGGEKPPFPGTINKDLEALIQKKVGGDLDFEILRAFLVFNSCILKTNFYLPNKTALAFRLDPKFLADSDYSVVPFALFMFIGAEFRGFHIRFEDIARGGIRMIKSPNKQLFQRNAETLFDENYNLALTQQKKNKDIPEGGSKGTILLAMDHQDKNVIAFQKYIDAMMDLLVANDQIVDHYGKPEFIFCGPDEGTADLMDWACLHAKSRGYRYWSAFTTGKSPSLGGIPHDLYGMTTRGIHEYKLGILRKLGLQEENIVKFQTGGPDGDLGSNEIKISKDKTKAIVDGSGVLYDPQGIDRTELLRLANKRVMVQEFDKSKLSKGGFLVTIRDKDVVLPDGTLVENGLNFRNSFHLNPLAAADLFVPCGGRPESVNINNVDKLFINGEPIFKYIVEGANLFFTQEARIHLEKAGVIIFKDASANKGGVTSSSLEVLAALSFTEDEYAQHMCVKDNKTPAFYEQYVQEVKERIAENARLEFECLWREHQKTGIPSAVLTDQLSDKINTLQAEICASSLWSDEKLCRCVLEEALPRCLQRLLGLDTIIKRVPQTYLLAILGAHLASRYIYNYGLKPNEFAFHMFMQKYTR
jgi:glutamate dehydrogenase